ncbi:MAG: acetoacetate decarboxylase family protein [Actinomycetia bacterium]|nr:acetoacetate decarboxylase family protein [Actinomycetes bacterium]
MTESKHWGEIDGVSIDFPMEVTDMNSATLTWSVPIEPARALIPGDGFEVADVGEGTAMLVLALVDYRENPWGDYDEVNFGMLVHPTGRPEEIGAFQWRMPVNQQMTTTAGREVLGLPKTVEELSFSYTDDTVTVELAMGGEPTLTATFPRPEPLGEPSAEGTLTYSYLDGVPTLVPLTIELPTGMIDPADVRLELGSSPAADELRSLGLPKSPDIAMWGEGLKGTFEWPTPV